MTKGPETGYGAAIGVARVRALLRHPVAAGLLRLLAAGLPILAAAIAVGSWLHLPRMSVQPALAGLACWTVGNYVFCPLRWHAVSFERRPLRWYGRVYAEGELLGMLTPQHAGADLWRIRQLTAGGAERGTAILEVATDRAAGGVALLVLAASFSSALTLDGVGVLLLAVGGLLALAAAARRWWLPWLRAIPKPNPRRIARGALISFLYQLGYVGFLLGVVAAVGHSIAPLAGAGLIGVSQLAGLLPGVHGAGPKEGALTGGLVALGVPLTASIGAVALAAALAWVPAVAVGGVGLAVRARRAGTAVG